MQKPWLVPAIAVSVALLVASLETTGHWIARVIDGSSDGWTATARTIFPVWLAFAVIVPFPAWMAARLPIDAARWRRRVPLHVLAAFAFCVVHLTINLFAQRLVNGPSPLPFELLLARQVGRYAAVELFIYWGIAGSFMLIQRERELRAREVTAARLASSLRQATLDALRARLQPHFLYNTLNAISVLAMKGQVSRVSGAIGHLGGLLRAFLDEDLPQRIPLARELELLERYLEIQRLRFPDRLRVERQVAPDTLDALVPSFILQPLVENAIQHGLGEVGGWVQIAAARAGERLEIEVTDSGPGIGAAATSGAGIGLANTRARLAELHGSAGELSLGTSANGGSVRLHLPYERAPAEAPARAAG